MGMDYLKALKTTKAMGKTPSLKECDEATLILDRIKQGRGFNGHHFVFEFYVESARGPYADRPGARVSEVFNLTGDAKKDPTKLSLVKAITDALGLEPDDLDRAMTDAAEQTEDGVPRVGHGYAYQGLRVRVSVAKDTRAPKLGTDGKPLPPMLLKQWMLADPPTPESISAAKRLLAGTPTAA